MSLIEKLKNEALKENHHIVLPEGFDERTLKAASVIINNKLAQITLIGNENEIYSKLKEYNVKDLPKVIDDKNNKYIEEFANYYYEKRKDKGETLDSSLNTMKSPLFIGSMMVEKGYADGCVAGAYSTSSAVLRSAFKVITKKKDIKTLSSFMIIETQMKEYGDNGTLFFSDVAVNVNPNAEELADIAITTAETWQQFMDSKAKVALLSFSSLGSAKDECLDKIIEAVKIAKNKRNDLDIDGELQLDAAIVKEVGGRKAPNSSVAGNANILIFPDLNSANIGYKLTERFSLNSTATGPILQGLSKPVNDLSRGASYEDIVNTVLVTSFQVGK